MYVMRCMWLLVTSICVHHGEIERIAGLCCLKMGILVFVMSESVMYQKLEMKGDKA